MIVTMAEGSATNIEMAPKIASREIDILKKYSSVKSSLDREQRSIETCKELIVEDSIFSGDIGSCQLQML